ncbi:MAG: transposase [Candidatus Daviesbacteria bacterium]|nr:transposase [Candidatus Daviesbacteria bacterium]
MPYRFIPFVIGEYYHIYNRGSEKRRIFEDTSDYRRFLKTLKYYQIEGPKPKFSNFPNLIVNKLDETKKIVEIANYCLMPNHFHLLIKQIRDGGITEFMNKSFNSYTKYYNTKHNRVGPLLQGVFKAVSIENDTQLIHISRYIHLNPISSHLTKDLNYYRWSSYSEYIDPNFNGFCFKKDILSLFKDPKDYQQFIFDQASYDLEFIQHQLIEDI